MTSFTESVYRLWQYRRVPFVAGVSLLLLGVLIVTIGVFMNMFIEKKLNESLEENLVVSSPNSKSYDNWVTNYDNHDLPPAYLNYYVWNLTNLPEVLEGGNPNVQLVGPYRYRKYFVKEDVTFSKDGNQVSYREKMWYIAEDNTLSLDLNVTLMNPAYMALVAKAGGERNLLAAMTGGVFTTLVGQLQSYTAALAVGQVSSFLIPIAAGDYINEGMTQTEFCQIWANSTSSDGFEIFGILSIEGIPSGITYTQCSSLIWGGAYSMKDSTPTGVSLWATFDMGNTTSIATIQKIFGLDSYQIKLLSLWRSTFQKKLVVPFVLNQFKSYGVTQLSDLGLVQWGQGKILNGQSLGTLAGLAGYPEFYFWQTLVLKTPNPVVFNLTRTRQLLYGPYGLTNTTNYQFFLRSLKAADVVTVQTLWGLNYTEAATMAGYYQYIGIKFTLPVFMGAINNGSGLFVTKTVQEWLWTGTDPLLALFSGPAASEYHLGKNNSITAYPSLFYTGNDDLDTIAQYIEYNGVAQYCGISVCGSQGLWENSLNVAGTNGRNNKPKLNTRFTPLMWSTEFLRPIDFYFEKTEKIHGVEVYKFVLSDDIFSVNPEFYQNIEGFGNLTHVSDAPIFICQAHMLGVNETYASKVTGQTPSSNDRIYISLEPFTGASFAISKKVQINAYIEPQTDKYSLFYPNIQTDIFFPLAYADEEAQITNSFATEFKHSYYDTLTYQKVALWGGISVGLAIVIVGFTLTLRVVYQSKKLLDTNYDPLTDSGTRPIV